MKIIAVLESAIDAGGAFNQGLNAILQIRRICDGRFDFAVFSTKKENIEELNKLGIICIWVPVTLVDKIIAIISNWTWWRRIQNEFSICGPFEKKLIENGCDLVYFLTQSSTPKILQQTNFITTVFDLCHRDMPEFPEVRSFGKFQIIEKHFKDNLSSAVIVVTESESLSDSVSRRYGIDRDRCLAMPMAKSPFLQVGIPVATSLVLKKYNLVAGYYFYPAQFWAHKNHIRILQALIHLRNEGVKYNVVFSGGDKGNKRYLEDFISQNLLDEQVKFLGFIPCEDMQGLYEGSSAVIMPTYFGPTNLPPFEAWFTKRPLIYSIGMKEQAGNAAIYVNPDDALDLASAMKACSDLEVSASLVDKGIQRLDYFDRLRQSSESELVNRLLQFEVRRICWK
jgi:glycosyltransferase involved in cell wall biosynthesis